MELFAFLCFGACAVVSYVAVKLAVKNKKNDNDEE